ncbi:MAG: metal ABC transporter solute-binding protein, Zn/Mn family [Candidatus Dormibacteria bacterium]
MLPSGHHHRLVGSAMAAGLVAGVVGLGAVTPGPLPALASGPAPMSVVTAENFWGSLAAQLGGSRVRVVSVVSDPNADPHEYETNARDARLVAGARLVIVNGAGYDTWADRLLQAQPARGRRVLSVARLLGKAPGANPHFWYDPSDVARVVAKVSAEYRALEPAQRGYFAAQERRLAAALRPYRERLASIGRRFRGVAIASTESVFAYLAQSLKLDLVTPAAFMEATSEGVDPPVSTITTFEEQLRRHSFRVLVYNVQTETPLTTALRKGARAAGIPVVGISETIQPPRATFEQWMDAELDRLEAALAAGARGR